MRAADQLINEGWSDSTLPINIFLKVLVSGWCRLRWTVTCIRSRSRWTQVCALQQRPSEHKERLPLSKCILFFFYHIFWWTVVTFPVSSENVLVQEPFLHTFYLSSFISWVQFRETKIENGIFKLCLKTQLNIFSPIYFKTIHLVYPETI